MEQVHRQAARLDVDAAELLGLAKRLRPRRLARLGERIDGDPTGRAGLGGQTVVRADPVGTERIERPVLQEDVDRLAERGGAGGQDRGGLELVVGAGEEDQVQGLVHDCHLDAALMETAAAVASLRSRPSRRDGSGAAREPPA